MTIPNGQKFDMFKNNFLEEAYWSIVRGHRPSSCLIAAILHLHVLVETRPKLARFSAAKNPHCRCTHARFRTWNTQRENASHFLH